MSATRWAPGAGVSRPTLHGLAGYCQRHDLDFAITAGGLRPGGGAPWTAAFRDFLRREWEAIDQVTGQPFGYSLLDQASFDYDTEPACRAVVTLSHLLAPGAQHGSEILAFFSGIQRKFHVDGQVPKALDFYRGLCAPCGISGAAFRAAFSLARNACGDTRRVRSRATLGRARLPDPAARQQRTDSPAGQRPHRRAQR
jgi:protein-disulfide isomerase-like protein with CxxC motif